MHPQHLNFLTPPTPFAQELRAGRLPGSVCGVQRSGRLNADGLDDGRLANGVRAERGGAGALAGAGSAGPASTVYNVGGGGGDGDGSGRDGESSGCAGELLPPTQLLPQLPAPTQDLGDIDLPGAEQQEEEQRDKQQGEEEEEEQQQEGEQPAGGGEEARGEGDEGSDGSDVLSACDASRGAAALPRSNAVREGSGRSGQQGAGRRAAPVAAQPLGRGRGAAAAAGRPRPVAAAAAPVLALAPPPAVARMDLQEPLAHKFLEMWLRHGARSMAAQAAAQAAARADAQQPRQPGRMQAAPPPLRGQQHRQLADAEGTTSQQRSNAGGSGANGRLTGGQAALNSLERLADYMQRWVACSGLGGASHV